MSNTSSDLLRLAAIAAGYEVMWYQGPLSGFMRKDATCPEWITWNPLEEDKDAFQLAVLLRLHTFMSPPDEHPQKAYAVRHGEVPWTSEVTSTPCAAMRRAIVCAAAEIGLIRKCGGEVT